MQDRYTSIVVFEYRPRRNDYRLVLLPTVRNDYRIVLVSYTGAQKKKWNTPQPNFKEGDLILLKYSSVVKNQWSHGCISKILPNKEGKVGCLEIIKPDGTILSQYIQNACKLEVDLE